MTPVQRIITTQKGIALDYDGLAGDTQAHSKELYMWGQSEEADIKDGALFVLAYSTCPVDICCSY